MLNWRLDEVKLSLIREGMIVADFAVYLGYTDIIKIDVTFLIFIVVSLMVNI